MKKYEKYTRISIAFKKTRQKLNMTQKELEELIAKDQMALSGFETGYSTPNLEYIFNFIDLFSIKLSDFLSAKIENAKINPKFSKKKNDIRSKAILGLAFYEARREANFTQYDVYLKTGISINSLSSYENGKTLPSLDVFLVLCELYHINIDLLVDCYLKRKVYFPALNSFIDNISGLTKKSQIKREVNIFLLDYLSDKKARFFLMDLLQEYIDMQL